MGEQLRLSDTKRGDIIVIAKILGHGAFHKRLREMGFVKGTKLEVIRSTPLSGPMEFRLMDYNIALRHSEAAKVLVIPFDKITHTQSHHYNGTIDFKTLKKSQNSSLSEINVALVGNPNCGKTSLFNFASGAKAKVANYAGVTIDLKRATIKHGGYTLNIVDLPGTYSLSSYTSEERYVRDYIYNQTPDVIANVLDASNLERNLFLTTQLIDMDLKVVGALNMYDELSIQKTTLYHESLGEMLGIPFIPTNGRQGTGVKELMDKIVDVFEGKDSTVRHIHINYGQEIENSIQLISKKIEATTLPDNFSKRFLAINLLQEDTEILSIVQRQDNDGQISSVCNTEKERVKRLYGDTSTEIIGEARYGFIQGALAETLKKGVGHRRSITKMIDGLVMNRWLAFPIFFLLMYLSFYSTFSLGSYPMDWIETFFGWLHQTIDNNVPKGILRDLLGNGIVDGVGGVIIFLPNILILFFLIALLEDTGYMARGTFIMDKLMHKMGLHGRSFIPMVMGFGCNVPAILATRTLRNKTDKLITILTIPFMSCSARLPVYLLIIGAIFPNHQAAVLMFLYVTGILLAFISARLLKRFVIREVEAPFVMELPPYRMPTLRTVLIHMKDKAQSYLQKVAKIILAASIVIWFLSYFPRQDKAPSMVEDKLSTEQPTSSTNLIRAEKQSSFPSQLEQSYLGQLGYLFEPALSPLGFDWRLSLTLLTGVAAKEVVVSSMGLIFANQEDLDETNETLRTKLQTAETKGGEPLFSDATAISFLLFVLIYMPCISVIAVIKKETGSWSWAWLSVVMTTILAWGISFIAYQTISLL